MASSNHRLAANFRDTVIKSAALRLSDVAKRNTTDYAEIIMGSGAPSGAYGRDSGATMIYVRSDASSANTCVYLTYDGGTHWDPVEANSDFGSTGIKSDVVAESSSGAGCTVDGMLIKDKQIDVSALATGEPGIKIPTNKADGFSIYDTAGDLVVFTTITGSQLVTWTTANAFSGGLQSDTIAEKTSAAGVTIDGTVLKDGGVTTDSTKGAAVGIQIDDGHTCDIQINDSTGCVTFRDAGSLTFNDSAGLNYLVLDSNTPKVDVGNATDNPPVNFLGTGLVSVAGALTVTGVLTGNGGISGNLTGNVTGNCSGSSGSCTGNSLTATSATSATSATTAAGLLSDGYALATIAVANATGGATDSALTVDLHQANGTTDVTSARQIMIVANSAAYTPAYGMSATTTYGTATKGSIIASGNGWCLAETSTDGEFDCTVTDSADETLYFHVQTASHGVSDVAKYCEIIGSNSDSATWSA